MGVEVGLLSEHLATAGPSAGDILATVQALLGVLLLDVLLELLPAIA